MSITRVVYKKVLNDWILFLLNPSMYKGTMLLEITIHQQHKENNGEVHNIKNKKLPMDY